MIDETSLKIIPQIYLSFFCEFQVYKEDFVALLDSNQDRYILIHHVKPKPNPAHIPQLCEAPLVKILSVDCQHFSILTLLQ